MSPSRWMLGLLFVVGCNDASKDIEKLADRACACTDAVCANKVIDDLVDYAHQHKNATGDKDRAEKAASRLASCAMKAGADPGAMIKKMEELQK